MRTIKPKETPHTRCGAGESWQKAHAVVVQSAQAVQPFVISLCASSNPQYRIPWHVAGEMVKIREGSFFLERRACIFKEIHPNAAFFSDISNLRGSFLVVSLPTEVFAPACSRGHARSLPSPEMMAFLGRETLVPSGTKAPEGFGPRSWSSVRSERGGRGLSLPAPAGGMWHVASPRAGLVAAAAPAVAQRRDGPGRREGAAGLGCSADADGSFCSNFYRNRGGCI